MNFQVVIPARLHSTRLPQKILMDIAGKPMLQHVYEKAIQSKAQQVIIATDSDKVYQLALSFGAKVCMTDEAHASGTERLAQVVDIFDFNDNTIIVNVQADEPLLPPALIDLVANTLDKQQTLQVATLAEKIHDKAIYQDPNVVKVVLDKFGKALYFSRAPIPWMRDAPDFSYVFKHIGLYAYRAGFIKQYTALAPSPLETIERLEQLRVLWHGLGIQVAITDIPAGIGVDTLQDIERVRQIIEG